MLKILVFRVEFLQDSLLSLKNSPCKQAFLIILTTFLYRTQVSYAFKVLQFTIFLVLFG
jgi:hypothetical protein